MKRSIRIGLIVSLLTLAVGYLITAAGFAISATHQQQCRKLQIHIDDQRTRQYVNSDELIQLIRANNLDPVGQPIHQVPTQQIEQLVSAHPMVRHAECYTTPSGETCVRLTQRQPILRVLTADDSYFVDSDHRRMPIRASVTDKLLTADGNIGQRMARDELADFVIWLNTNSYWRERVRKIHVVNPRRIELVQNNGEPTIVLEQLGDCQRQLDKLRTLYERGLQRMDSTPTYRELDLRYEGQVVARK